MRRRQARKIISKQFNMRKTENNLILLNIIFVVSIVVANVVGCKIIDTGLDLWGLHLSLSGGAITYAFTFLCTDIIGEIWGKKEAHAAVLRGFIGQVFAILLIVLTQHTPTADADMQAAYVKLLGQAPFFTIGSLSAYWASQTWDVYVFHKIRGKLNAKPSLRWIWNNLSTATSQIIDTCIYAFISFGLGLGLFWADGGLATLFGLIAGQYLLKLCLAILDTPFFYFFTRPDKVKEVIVDSLERQNPCK